MAFHYVATNALWNWPTAKIPQFPIWLTDEHHTRTGIIDYITILNAAVYCLHVAGGGYYALHELGIFPPTLAVIDADKVITRDYSVSVLLADLPAILMELAL